MRARKRLAPTCRERAFPTQGFWVGVPSTAADSQGVSAPVTIAFHRLRAAPTALFALSRGGTIRLSPRRRGGRSPPPLFLPSCREAKRGS
jgi:hypothetical protein